MRNDPEWDPEWDPEMDPDWEPEPEPPAEEHPPPGPGTVVRRTLPVGMGIMVAAPALALLVPHGGGRYWSLGIMVLLMLVFFFAMFSMRRGLPLERSGVKSAQYNKALSAARPRRRGLLPTDRAVGIAAAHEAVSRVQFGAQFTYLAVGYVLGFLVRPDLNWMPPPMGFMLAFAIRCWVQCPRGWNYLRLYAEKDPYY